MFQSTHKLEFLAKPWFDNWIKFKIGTVEGAYRAEKDNYSILALINNTPGNGHFTDVLEWFEHSCKRDKKNLVIRELMNPEFKKHLLTQKGFTKYGKDDLIKHFGTL